MSERQAAAVVKPAAKPAAAPSRGVVQRQCACGQHASNGGECESCKRKRLEGVVQRAPANASTHNSLAVDRDYSQVPTRIRSHAAAVIQPKLTINQPGDIYEQEADRIANQVMAVPKESYVQRVVKGIQRLAGRPTGPAEPAVTAGAAGESTAGMTEPDAQANVPNPVDGEGESQLTMSGSPLPYALRAFYESRFGYDLSAVRIHTGSTSERLNNSFQARAFTYRSHIWLGPGEQLAPSYLLAHELVHTIQQDQPARTGSSINQNGQTESPQTYPREPLLQRLAVYWAPNEAVIGSGKAIEDALYSDFSGPPELTRKVNIPNGARKKFGTGGDYGFHVRNGEADLYAAEGKKRIGVSFRGEDRPERIPNGKSPRPRVREGKGNEGNSILNIDEGPSWVKIGEIKPASREQIAGGKEQTQAYIEGIKLAHKETNKWAAARNQPKWQLNALDVLGDQDLKLNTGYKFQPGSPVANTELILVDFSSNGKVKKVFDPQRDIGQRVMGGLYADYFGGGVWAYFARPADPTAVINNAGVTQEQGSYINLAQALQNEVVDQVTGAPIQPMALRKNSAPNSSTPQRAPSKAPNRVQRAVKEAPKMRDNFNLQQVKASRKRLHARLNAQENTAPFKKLRFIELAYQAEDGFQEIGKTGGKRLPDKSQLNVSLKTSGGKSTPGTVNRSLPTLYRWLNVWTHPTIDILLGFRSIFGKTFVTVSEKLRGFKEKIQKKLSSVFDNKAGGSAVGTSYGAVAVRAIGRALKAVARILIPQTLRFIVEGMVNGAKERLLAYLPLDLESLEAALRNGFSEIDTVFKKIEELKAGVEERVRSIEEKFGGYLGGITDLLKKASDVASTVKWAVRAVQCLTPPGWGCLKLLLSSLTAWIAEKVLNYCPLQKKVACIVASVDFVQTGIPKAVANAIGNEFNDVLAAIHPSLSPLFKPLKDVPPVNCSDIGCDGEISEWDIAYSRLLLELERKYGFWGAAKMVDSLIEMSHVFGPDESAGLTAGEIDKLRKLLLLYEVTPDELERVVEIIKQKKMEGSEIKHATVEEFGKAIEQYRESLGNELAPTPAAGDAANASEHEAGAEGGSGEASTNDDKGANEGKGISTVSFNKATFNGKPLKDLDRSWFQVENPDFMKHTQGSHQVTLLFSIDRIAIKRITDVPVDIPMRVWKNPQKTQIIIYYKLKQGVRADHSVPGVPSPVVLEKGRQMGVLVDNPNRARKAAAGQNEPSSGKK